MTTEMMLVTAEYVGGKITLKFYDSTKRRMISVDAGKYDPYCYTLGGNTKLHDLLEDKEKGYTKAWRNAESPKWEDSISVRNSYLYDNDLRPGMWYVVENGKMTKRKIGMDGNSSEILERIFAGDVGRGMPDKERYKERMQETTVMLNEPIPDMYRVAFDIEIGGTNTEGIEPKSPTRPVTAISFASPTEATCLLVGTGKNRKVKARDGTVIEVIEYENESQMLEAAFERLGRYPFWVTYYGREFDLPYLYHRASTLGITAQRKIMREGDFGITPTKSVHIDAFDIFSNPALYAYAFGAKYESFGLEAVATAMFGGKKTSSGDRASTMTADILAEYCYTDSRLTYDLTSYDDNTVMQMLTILARISCLGMDTISETRVSTWIQSMWHHDHRRMGCIIPRRVQLDEKTTKHNITHAESVIKDKKYRGGMVMEQKLGTYWNMTVLDFASMYPHIIQIHNLSYETIMCPHDDCRDNHIPGTSYWKCKKRNGILPMAIGTLRELRVKYYKMLSKDPSLDKQRQSTYSTIAGTIKVLMNASYGVAGSEHFGMYFLPVADSTTAAGRKIISDTVEISEAMGVEVLYGDTDSLFVTKVTPEIIEKIITETRDMHGVELEIDKEYRYALMTGLKKNYLGIREDGSADIKGLTGKKSNVPPYIRNAFSDSIDILSEVSDESDLQTAKKEISDLIRDRISRIRAGDVSLSDMTYAMRITKPLSEYGKPPQHVKAASMLESKYGVKIGVGATVRFVKSKGTVRPFELARISDIDSEKYVTQLRSTMDQILPALGMSTESVISGNVQANMESYIKNPSK